MKIKLGISSCLLGNKVRFDGSHKWDRFITDTIGKYVEYVSVCPEVECGFGTPREPLRLVGDPNDPRLMTIRTGENYTGHIVQWAHKRVVELKKEDLWGFIFKSRSPSCGQERVKVFSEAGIPAKRGMGIFARIFREHFPLLPIEDEEHLHNPQLRENFIERIFIYRRWRDIRAQKESQGNLVNFHTRHKLLILAHSPKYHGIMGKLVAKTKDLPLKEVYLQYQKFLMEVLRLKATSRKNAKVLQHIMAYFEKDLTSDEKQGLREAIHSYRQGDLPLLVPITLLNHYVGKYDLSYLKEQYYLNPYPVELQLRNHA